MFQEHPAIRTPSDDNLVVWRYMDFTKFMSLVEARSLFFCSGEMLSRGDKHECTYPRINYDIYESVDKGINCPVPIRREDYESLRAMSENMKKSGQFSGLTDLLRTSEKISKDTTAISCWHISEYESDAMWKVYARNGEGIAIQSTVGRLKACFSPYERPVYIGLVEYSDGMSNILPTNNLFHPVFHKRNFYSHERELRVAIAHHAPRGQDCSAIVPIEVETLIDKIYVSPRTGNWFHNLVSGVASRYSLSVPVIQSEI